MQGSGWYYHPLARDACLHLAGCCRKQNDSLDSLEPDAAMFFGCDDAYKQCAMWWLSYAPPPIRAQTPSPTHSISLQTRVPLEQTTCYVELHPCLLLSSTTPTVCIYESVPKYSTPGSFRIAITTHSILFLTIKEQVTKYSTQPLTVLLLKCFDRIIPPYSFASTKNGNQYSMKSIDFLQIQLCRKPTPAELQPPFPNKWELC